MSSFSEDEIAKAIEMIQRNIKFISWKGVRRDFISEARESQAFARGKDLESLFEQACERLDSEGNLPGE